VNTVRTTQRAISDSTDATSATQGHAQYLTFALDAQRFAVEILAVKEIIQYHDTTLVPMMPPWIRGVINLRGAVVPVMDMGVRLGLSELAVTKRTCIIIVEVDAGAERHDVGAMVDSVNKVLEIPRADVEFVAAFGSGMRTDFMRGLAKVDEGFVVVLDSNRVLSMEDSPEPPTAAAATHPTAHVGQ
jgi:purine-binding chemotaxis protein CheW